MFVPMGRYKDLRRTGRVYGDLDATGGSAYYVDDRGQKYEIMLTNHDDGGSYVAPPNRKARRKEAALARRVR